MERTMSSPDSLTDTSDTMTEWEIGYEIGYRGDDLSNFGADHSEERRLGWLAGCHASNDYL